MLLQTAEAFIDALGAFDPLVADRDDCARVATVLARVERLCRFKKVTAALRATSDGATGRDQSPDASHWLATQSGSSVAASKRELALAAAVAACPQTASALAAGELSLEQAAPIVAAVDVAPAAEDELLEVARTSTVGRLREVARRRRHDAIGAEDIHRRQREARRFRWWTDDLGMVAFSGALPPEEGVPFVRRVGAACDRRWRAARADARAGRAMEPREAYAADALVEISLASRGPRPQAAEIVIVVDLRAWRRGDADAGELCRIVGSEGVPVRVAKALADDAFFKAVVHDGTNVLTVKHFGRRMSAELRTALELGTPPDFEGLLCAESGCGARHGLEWDHIDPVANGGMTSLDNLQPKCRRHHQAKTAADREAGLLSGVRPDRPP